MKKLLSGVLCAVMAVSMVLPHMSVAAATLPDHVIINQVYGNGGKTEAAVSHNFIELYNPTEQSIDLSGYQIEVSKDGSNAAVLNLGGTIPARTSYLIRGEESAGSTPKCVLDQADLDLPDLQIDNKDFVIRLKADGTVMDNVTVVDGDGILEVSKQKSIRRKDFQDTASGDTWNEADFEIIEYKGAGEDLVNQYRPRTLADGSWPAGSSSDVSGGDKTPDEDVSGGDKTPDEDVSGGDKTPDEDVSGGDNAPEEDGGDISGSPMQLPDTLGTTMRLYSSYSVGATNEDGGVAEIVKYNKENQRMYVVSGQLQSVDIVDILADGSTRLYKRILVGELGKIYGFDAGDITSVDVNTQMDIIALAVQSSIYDMPGKLVLLDYEGNYLAAFTTGIQPDMVCFSPNGKYVMTADEGEPREGYGDGTVDPKGSVTLVELQVDNLQDSKVKVCDFTQFDGVREQLVQDKVLLKKNTLPSLDLEPEYIAVSEDSTTAYISLQENNAIASLDLATGTYTSVKGLGFKDHSLEGNGLDLNKDGKAQIQQEEVLGVYMPDGLAAVTIGGVTYLLTPNEGDAREWGDYADIDSKKINGSEKKVEYLINEEFDGLEADKTYILGGRSFSIFRADTMELVYDSGDDFEQITAALYPDYFNSNHKEAGVDGRSNKKGPEPEDVKTLTVDGRVYAFIGLERIGGIMMYDITNPQTPVFVDYLNNRDFSESDLAKAGDLGAEGICTIEARYSPTGYPMILVANEISGTVSVIGLTNAEKYQPESGDKETEDTEQNSGNSGSSVQTSPTYNVNWDEVAGNLNNLEQTVQSAATAENQVLNVVTGSRICIPGRILDQLYGKDQTVIFHTGTGIAFSIAGQEVLQNNGELNLTCTEETFTDGAANSVSLDGTPVKAFTVADQGIYPVNVNLHLALGAEKAGSYANLYIYDEAAGTEKYIGSYLINKDGQSMFALSQGGRYLVTLTVDLPKVTEQIYVVKKGDTLSKIARAYHIGLQKLMEANRQLQNPNRLYPGQEIYITK